MTAWARMLMGLAALMIISSLAGTWYLLPRDDVPDQPDAVVVLGGVGPERAALGIELADLHDAQLVLSSSAAIFGEQQGRRCDREAICIEPEPETTRGEARTVASMAEDHGWHHITVATASFHTSRSRFLFRQCLGADGVSVVGAEAPGPSRTTPATLLREAAGILAGATVQRAC